MNSHHSIRSELINHPDAPDGPPDRVGEDYGVVYAAWQVRPLDSPIVGKIHVFCADAQTGEHLPGSEPRTYRRGRREIPYHWTGSWEEVPRVLRVLYWRQLRTEPDRPLESLQKQFRKEQVENARQRGREVERRRYKRETVRKACRWYGCAPEQVKGYQRQAVIHAGNRMARGSYAHR